MTAGVAFLDLRPGVCRFPLGAHDDPPVLFCDAPAMTGSSYCACHHRIAYVPATKRRPPQGRERETSAMIEAGSVTDAR